MNAPLPPGSTIGIIGGGQLGRMLAIAAAQIGYRTHIFDPDPDCCAGRVSAAHTVAGFDDAQALARFAAHVDVVTYEFENVDPVPLNAIAGQVPILPPLAALKTAQDRVAEKEFAQRHDIPTAPWRRVDSLADLHRAIPQLGTPAILKTARFGYDGKGQSRVETPDDAARAWSEIGGQPAILEAMMMFDHEFSVLLARGGDKSFVTWDVPVNVHRDGILDTSTIPAPAIVRDQADLARDLAVRIAEALDYIGVLAVEFFATATGPVFNEMAPRVHNSGHWTIEGAQTSQFENHIRAICGLPLGDTRLTAPSVCSTNIIGAEADDWHALFATPGGNVHLYDKGLAAPGRKMGHVTRLGLIA